MPSNTGQSSSQQPSPPAVQVDSVSYTYPPTGFDRQGTQALADLDLTINPCCKLGILGPNGGGKSTLIKLILGILKPTTGSVQVFGLSPVQARKQGLVGYLPQRIQADTDWPINVQQAVALAFTASLKPWKSLSDFHNQSIEEALQLLDLTDLATKPIGALSGGQLQRVMIARAIVTKPKLLVLDEPTVGVDIAGQQRFGELISQLQSKLDLTVIVVTHDMRTIAAVANRVACLSRTLHFHDAPQGLTPAVLAQVFAHNVEGVFGEIHIDAHRADDCDDPTHAAPPCGCQDHSQSKGDE